MQDVLWLCYEYNMRNGNAFLDGHFKCAKFDELSSIFYFEINNFKLCNKKGIRIYMLSSSYGDLYFFED